MAESDKIKPACEYPATMHGLKIWHKKMFEQLGWIVLANKKGYEFKINAYKLSLELLKEKLKCKIDSIKSQDKKEDLKIMLSNVKVLISHVKKDFN